MVIFKVRVAIVTASGKHSLLQIENFVLMGNPSAPVG